jgi:hypothetical protein
MAIDTDFEHQIYRAAQAPGPLFETFAQKAMRRVEDIIVSRDCQWPPERAHIDLLHLLRGHQGRGRAVALLALVERLHTNERAVKQVVADLRTHFGVLICSGRGGEGYWIAATEEDVTDTLKPYRAQALTEIRTIVAMERGVRSIDQILNQFRLELQEGARPALANKHSLSHGAGSFLNTSKCKGCGAAIDWWEMNNAKKSKVAFNHEPNSYTELTRHFETCPNADQFKGRGSTAPATVRPTPAPAATPTLKTLEQELCRLLDRHRARSIALVQEDGIVVAWRPGLPPEDLRQELITAANQVRREATVQQAARGGE